MGRTVQITVLCALIAITTAPAVLNAASPSHSLTIEQISSAPFPSQLTPAPAGNLVAWVYNERGARNVWIAEPGASGFKSKRLTAYTADDGNDIVDLAWNGDSRTLFFVRGGDSDGRQAVNPLSLAAGPKAGEIWSVAIEGGAPKHIADGTDPTPSPHGDRLVFVHGGQPFLVQTAGPNPSEATPLFHDQGRVRAMIWSPDGTRLAFVSSRTQHSLIGIFDFSQNTITWVSPGIDDDEEPVWSPDGKRLAFLRLAHDTTPPYVLSYRDSYPWEIWVADTTTGKGARLWGAKAGAGSHFRELFNSRHSLFWASGARLVFPWEVTGWVRLYSISAKASGEPTLLTPGNAEIFGAELSANRERLVYASNLGDLDRRHIWSISLNGGAPQQLTTGQGVEDYPILTSDGTIYALHGDARVPLRPIEVAGRSMTDIAPDALPHDFPTTDLVEPQLITFQAADGLTVHGQLFIPRGRTAKGPALLFFHGGPTNRQAFAAWDPFETHSHLYEANQYLANHGYIVLSVNYRGGSGYGLNFREPQGFAAGGASELNDIIGAARYMISRSDVDSKKLGVWGGSYGGRMTSLALAAAPEFFAAGADYAGVHNWVKMPGFSAPDGAAEKLAYESSAIGHVGTWRAPVLLMHADADPAVPFEQTAELAAALRSRGIPVEYLMIPDEVHFLLKHSSWSAIFAATGEYMDRQLKP
jgi:dipeptidyl aminopeptidase/acylaminoacyl peptidase